MVHTHPLSPKSLSQSPPFSLCSSLCPLSHRLPLFLCPFLSFSLRFLSPSPSLSPSLSLSKWLCFLVPPSSISRAQRVSPGPRPSGPHSPLAPAARSRASAARAHSRGRMVPTARRLPGIAPPARSLGRKCAQSRPRFLGGSGLSGSSEPAPSRGPSAPAGRAEPRDPEGGGRTCQPGRLPGEGLPSSPRSCGAPGAEEREKGAGVRVRARSRPGIRYEPVTQPGRPRKLRAGPSSSVSPTALARDLHAAWELLSVPYEQVTNKLFTLITWDSNGPEKCICLL